MSTVPRVAFFTDTFAEINGVALTSRQLTEFAHRHDRPFLCVRGGEETRTTVEGSVTHLELKRGPLAFELDRGLRHDPFLWRFLNDAEAAVKQFRPDIIHVVSPGDVSEMGKIPLAISWHTNLHEFGAMRLEKALSWMSDDARKGVVTFSEAQILNVCLVFYRLGDVLFAPNEELVEMLREGTGKPVFLMKRGIDTDIFNPSKRTIHDGIPRIGYAGRITPEKSVRFLRTLERDLIQRGIPDFRFLIIGDGSEREWLMQNLENADLPGIHRGEELAVDYANMDIFAFPSRTDTFGNVVLEAFASGTPAVVTDAGGPKFIVKHGVSGFTASSEDEFVDHCARLLFDTNLRHKMAEAARQQALGESWDSVFEKVYDGYRVGIEAAKAGATRAI